MGQNPFQSAFNTVLVDLVFSYLLKVKKVHWSQFPFNFSLFSDILKTFSASLTFNATRILRIGGYIPMQVVLPRYIASKEDNRRKNTMYLA